MNKAKSLTKYVREPMLTFARNFIISFVVVAATSPEVDAPHLKPL